MNCVTNSLIIIRNPCELHSLDQGYTCIYVLFCFDFLPLQKKQYRSQLESMLVAHVFPEFQSPLGYMRARVSGASLIPRPSLTAFHFFSTAAKKAVREGLGMRLEWSPLLRIEFMHTTVFRTNLVPHATHLEEGYLFRLCSYLLPLLHPSPPPSFPCSSPSPLHPFPPSSIPLFLSLLPQACWMLHYFSEVIFQDQSSLQYGLQQVRVSGLFMHQHFKQSYSLTCRINIHLNLKCLTGLNINFV